MKESELLSFAMSTLKNCGILCWRVQNQASMHQINGKMIMKRSPIKGFPDIAGVFPNGKFFAIELKTEKGRLSPEQTEWITKLNMSGAMAIVLRSTDEIADFAAAAMKIRTK